MKNVNIPGKRMRVRFTKGDQGSGGAEAQFNTYVILVEELRDFYTALSIFQRQDRTYRTSGLSLRIRLLESPYAETPQVENNIRTSLIKPLTKLRYLKDVEVNDMAPFVAKMILGEVLETSFNRPLIIGTVHNLIFSGDCACNNGLFDIATAYYQRASEYFHHFATNAQAIFMQNPGDPIAIEFKIMQHRALN